MCALFKGLELSNVYSVYGLVLSNVYSVWGLWGQLCAAQGHM